MTDNPTSEHYRIIIETVLLAASEPLSIAQLRSVFDNDLGANIIRVLLEELQTEWAAKKHGIELVQLASGWRFQTQPSFQRYLDKLKEDRPPRYSRAVLETLAIITYRQPVTRGDIEEIRGVTVSPNILKTLEARGWIDIVGHRETPGRPELFATTKCFLNDLGLRSLTELPALTEIERIIDLVDISQTTTE